MRGRFRRKSCENRRGFEKRAAALRPETTFLGTTTGQLSPIQIFGGGAEPSMDMFVRSRFILRVKSVVLCPRSVNRCPNRHGRSSFARIHSIAGNGRNVRPVQLKYGRCAFVNRRIGKRHRCTLTGFRDCSTTLLFSTPSRGGGAELKQKTAVEFSARFECLTRQF